MITLTERAAEKIKDRLAKRGSGIGIMIGVRTTGCSGLAYVLEYVDDLTKMMNGYQPFTQHDATVFVKELDMVYLDELVVDYVKKGLNESSLDYIGGLFMKKNSKFVIDDESSVRIPKQTKSKLLSQVNFYPLLIR
jgi:iron-sulfur cluster assembly protein